MEFYKKYRLSILAEDRDKADKILMKHWDNGDLDDIGGTRHMKHNGGFVIIYWIAPYVYEDFETIKKEFKEAGIRIILRDLDH